MEQVGYDWSELSSQDSSLEIFRDLAQHHARLGGDTHGAAINTLLYNGEWEALCRYELPVNDPGWDVEQLWHCRQALAFFSKVEELELGIDREAEAYKKFVESEARCKTVNDTFRAVYRGSAYLRPRDVRLLESMRRKIYTMLGPCPRISQLKLRMGPGATTSIRKTKANPQSKMAAGNACSTNLYLSGLLPELLRSCPHLATAWATDEKLTLDWNDDEFQLCEEWEVPVELHPGALGFVAKNAKTFRSIVVEPFLNGLLQLGIGDAMEKRLRFCGLDIKTQPEKQGRAARVGSLTGQLATLDLSSASDTIAYWLVKYLLPDAWFKLLNAARSGIVRYKKTDHVLEKFSSMGNGFTFPLETLIFYSLALSVTPEGARSEVGVFGDDIIVPTGAVPDLLHGLELCGFVVNSAKSFTDGPFRESCGCDYYNGIECRPKYMKHLASAESLFSLHNYYYRTKYFAEAAAVLERIPLPLRLFGPDGYGDGHLIDYQWAQRKPRKLLDKGFGGSVFDTYQAMPRKWLSIYPGDYVTPLYSIYRKGREPLVPAVPKLKALFARHSFALGQELSGELSEGGEVLFTKNGRPYWSLPGSEGYRRVSIYTLST